MRIVQAATLRKTYIRGLQAGGPGSGCRGPNCGRPATAHDDALKSIGDAINPGQHSVFLKKDQDAYFKSLGFSQQETDEFRERMDAHSRDHTQAEADKDIEQHFGTDSRFGQWLTARANAEMYLLQRKGENADAWYEQEVAAAIKDFETDKRLGISNYDPEYDGTVEEYLDNKGLWEYRKMRDDAKNPVFHRRGGLGKAVLSTTTDSAGAATKHIGDDLRIEPTHKWKLSQLMKEGYVPVAGASSLYGYVGEGEVLFVRRKDQ